MSRAIRDYYLSEGDVRVCLVFVLLLSWGHGWGH